MPANEEDVVSDVIEPNENIDIGLPTFDAEQQVSFQSWYVTEMTAKKDVLLKALKHLQAQADLAESQGMFKEARAKVEHAKELHSLAENLGTTEHMREESWRSFRGNAAKT